MASFNKVILLGNLTRDPQVKHTPGGTAMAELGLAVNRTWFDKAANAKREETTFVDVTLWGRDAEVAGEYLAKGRPVLIEGRLSLDSWEDKATGQKRSKLKVVGERMQMLGSRGDPEGQASGSKADQRGAGGASGPAESDGPPAEPIGYGRGEAPPDDSVPF